jgi:hypothetical protein
VSAADAQRAPNRRKKRLPREYGADSVTFIVPEPAARAWILENSANPSAIYRERVLGRLRRPESSC